MFDVKGKVALVTGGASGIGLACAEELLKKGGKGVAIVDVNEQKGIIEQNNLNRKYGLDKVLFVKANVARKTELEEAFKKTVNQFKHLDIVFNNAGVYDENDYEIGLSINLIGVVHCLKLALDEYLPKYKSGPEAVVINTASMMGLAPFAGVEMYSTAKFGVVALTRNFGMEFHYKRTGVRVLAICPDITLTPLANDFGPRMVYKELKPIFMDMFGSQNMQTAEQVAKVCTRLVEDAENGSVWYIKRGKEAKIEFPDLLKNLNM